MWAERWRRGIPRIFARTMKKSETYRNMRADSASHLLRQPVMFELFLFFYLVCVLLLQETNVYKMNFHLIDFNLVFFTVILLIRRLAWCCLQELQTHWSGKSPSMNLKRWSVGVCTLAVIVWSVVRLVQNTSLFNLLFLFYPLLLYLSLFGCTLEPRIYRSRFRPPRRFLQHLDLTTRLKPHRLAHRYLTSSTSSNMANSAASPVLPGGRATPPSGSPPGLRPHDPAPQNSEQQSTDVRYTWEYSLLLPATPEEIRQEVEILLSDLVVRLKQLLFNSLLCAYYVGFIPMQFADSHSYYDRWWCVEHSFLVWANSFVLLASHLLPPSYCQVLYQCALHLGCWTRCPHDNTASVWSPDVIWPYDVVVQWNGESFRGEGLQNVAIPCNSSQECFYLLFHSRLHVHTWLLALQSVIVAFQIVVLLRSVFWYQVLSMSVFLCFSYFVLYRLLCNRLLCRKLPLLI